MNGENKLVCHDGDCALIICEHWCNIERKKKLVFSCNTNEYAQANKNQIKSKHRFWYIDRINYMHQEIMRTETQTNKINVAIFTALYNSWREFPVCDFCFDGFGDLDRTDGNSKQISQY